MRRFCPFPSRARPPANPRVEPYAPARIRRPGDARRRATPTAPAGRCRALFARFPPKTPILRDRSRPCQPPARPSPPRRATAKLRVPRPAHARFSGPPGRLQAACEPLLSPGIRLSRDQLRPHASPQPPPARPQPRAGNGSRRPRFRQCPPVTWETPTRSRCASCAPWRVLYCALAFEISALRCALPPQVPGAPAEEVGCICAPRLGRLRAIHGKGTGPTPCLTTFSRKHWPWRCTSSSWSRASGSAQDSRTWISG